MLNTIKRQLLFWQHPKVSDRELILDRRRIYILPGKSGLIFALILLSIFVTSINYGINLGYALNFILLSCGWLSIIFTFKNLTGIGLEASISPAVFTGELAHFSIHLNNRSRQARYAIAIGFDKSSMQLADIPEYGSHSLTLPAITHHRGRLPCPRIRIQTAFPFGLLTAWSYWKNAQQIIVYPTPEINPPPLPYAAEGSYVASANVIAGNEEFSGVRNYQSGDSLKQLAWRQMARQSGGSNEFLISKHFEGGQRHVCILDFSEISPQLNVEQKLSRLCAWLLLAEEQHVSYAFKLGAVQFVQNSGADHQRACLTALALFNTTEGDES